MDYLKLRIVLLFFILKAIYCQNPEKPLGKFLYEELKCLPQLHKVTNELTSYKCNDLVVKDFCMFEGKKVKLGEEIDDSGTELYCRTHCSCNAEGTFDCAEDDCYEDSVKPKSGCRYVDSLTDCCRVSKCGEPSNTNCTVDGTTYPEGRSFSPKNECKLCLCEKGFDGKFEKPHCIKRRCLEQIFNMNHVMNNCAPAYFQADQCCPATWVCNANQKLVKYDNSNNSRSELTCQFGSETVPFGYGFETTVRPYSTLVNVRCECRLPPFVTCLEILKSKI